MVSLMKLVKDSFTKYYWLAPRRGKRGRPGRGGGLPRKSCDVTTASLFEDSTTHIIIASSTLTVEGYQICSSLCTDQYASVSQSEDAPGPSPG